MNAEFELAGSEEKTWSIVAEVNQDSSDVVSLINTLKEESAALKAQLERDIDACTADLVAYVANADGLQVSGDHLSATHHFANVLFNIMRGGIFVDNHSINKSELCDFIETRNRDVLHAQQAFFDALPGQNSTSAICSSAPRKRSQRTSNACVTNTCRSRSAAGTAIPSRPWNQFSINLKNPDGTRKLDYQGNWRDIFQNWEPLAYAYPEFIEGMICKFLNATTADGYNPYRLTRDGIEWEAPEPDDPWANIGYWSDHQIIYLQKLLEIATKYHPGTAGNDVRSAECSATPTCPTGSNRTRRCWKIRTIRSLFDRDLDQEIDETVTAMGTDAKLILDADRRVFHVNLAEKLLILLLAKLSNFVPEGGIWMNTQRPEWNDANNALVGKGLSVVTACYLRRYIVFCRDLLAGAENHKLELTQEASGFLDAVNSRPGKAQGVAEHCTLATNSAAL